MWLLVMFDLPTDTKKARKAYSLFRKSLLRAGFNKMQYSVYSRHCASLEQAESFVANVIKELPPDGEVRVMTITDKQFERMDVFQGKSRKIPEPPPLQLQLF
ncbi:MAG: CRISPR-associated endonuclease Cas2 [Planctomycetes bacterium]|nr:CRISPR-associated endonuclease Cas2 [Planctomycetota bacterium]